MKLSELYCYFINPDNYIQRREKMSYLYEQGFKSVNRIVYNGTDEGKIRIMNKAHYLAVETALACNHFPVLILEDDAALIRELPKEFTLEGDLIYWGGSNYHSGLTPKMEIEDFNQDYKRVKFMLSAHSIIYPTRKSAEMVLSVLKKAILANEFNDVHLALESNKHLFLIPKNGFYFYQDDYTREVTRFDY